MLVCVLVYNLCSLAKKETTRFSQRKEKIVYFIWMYLCWWNKWMNEFAKTCLKKMLFSHTLNLWMKIDKFYHRIIHLIQQKNKIEKYLCAMCKCIAPGQLKFFFCFYAGKILTQVNNTSSSFKAATKFDLNYIYFPSYKFYFLCVHWYRCSLHSRFNE